MPIRQSTASIAFLNRRAFYVAIGAKHTAVTGKRAKQLTATLAVIVELASVYGHLFFLAMTTVGTSQRREGFNSFTHGASL